jgi:hypothetical protein
MPIFKKKERGRGSWSAEDMESLVVAKINGRGAPSRVNLLKSLPQDRISKIRKCSEVQIAPKRGNLSEYSPSNMKTR